MQLIFGPKVDIQHFNVLLPTTGLLNTMPHYYAADLWSKVDNILMCLANNWPPQYYALTTMQLIFGPRWIFNILMSSCQQLASTQCTPHYYAADLWSKGYSTF
jgi:hypothetical protein